MTRKVMDCSQVKSDPQCTLKMSGEEGEVLDEAVRHAVARHGEKDTPEFRDQLRKVLKDEPEKSRQSA